MTLKVVMVVRPEMPDKDMFEMMKAAGAAVSMHTNRETEETILPVCADADCIITQPKFMPLTSRVLRGLPKCRYIITLSVGYDAIDVKAATELGIGIVNMRGLMSEEIAEHTMALILAHTRWILGLNERVRTGKPEVAKSATAMKNMSTLKGKTLGLVGFGNVARAVVPKARGFNMHVIAHDPYIDEALFKESGVEKVGLDSLLETSDFISIHAVLTPENQHSIGAEQFKKMKRNAYIINTARGSIIDEQALCAALRNGDISGAGLDVTDPEPVPLDSPLLQFENVILTGHQAGTSNNPSQISAQVTEEIKRIMHGEWPFGLVNHGVKEKYTSKWSG